MITGAEDTAFHHAWTALTRYAVRPVKLSDLLEGLPEEGRSPAQRLVMAAFRDYLFLQWALQPLLRRKPKPRLQALLLLALAECVDAEEGRRARVLHHAVEQAKLHLSAAEARMVNAVGRKALQRLEVSPLQRARLNHPAWLYDRWVGRFGTDATRRLCQWNQQDAPVYLRCPADKLPAGAQPTVWADFYRVDQLDPQEWLPVVRSGDGYIQDPMTRHPIELLAVQPGDRVLDLCAAPGGKSCWLLQQLDGRGELVAVDVPGKRLQRLQRNLAGMGRGNYTVLGLRLPATGPQWNAVAKNPGLLFDKVLIDVPCSNTGVLQRKPDVRLRLQPADMVLLPGQQLEWLCWAALRVRPGGYLVYSTCSIESEENEGVIDGFLQKMPGFRLRTQAISHPWVTAHDGGGAFLLQKD